VSEPGAKLAPAGFLGKRGVGWALLASWLVPGMMILAYIVLMITSETDNTGKAWMAIGLAFVLVLWWLFRLLSEHAAMARAVAVGDADRVLELAGNQLARRRGDAARAPFLVYRALAHEIRGDWERALAEADAARPGGAAGRSWELLAATVRIAALVETGKVEQARELLDREVEPRAKELDPRTNASALVLATLARGRVLCAEGSGDAALAQLERVIDDVRAGSSARAVAHAYAARCSRDPAAAQRHRKQAAQLGPGTWAARAG